MPRRRPGALRAARGSSTGRRPPAWARDLPRVDRLPPAASAEIHRTVPGSHYLPGELLMRYRRFLRAPGGRLLLTHAVCPAPGCELDDVAVVRSELAAAYRSLPPAARTALGRILRPLDDELRRRTVPDPDAPAAGRDGAPRPWWHRRLYGES
ncbi:hypothetical protein ACFWUZ_24195 [Streptomyces sp. NPDC058646]|uniref:hypothetical protein n=1 Tax=Streptomyces sp. NPDC058646 TaxID=3346574 RepID=UPI00364FCE10